MINRFQYDEIFDDLIVLPDPKDKNLYTLKNKLDEDDAVIIGTIKWIGDNFYLTLKEYIDLEAEYLRGIAEYMEGLEYNPIPIPDSPTPEPAATADAISNIGALAGMFGGMSDIMPPIGQEPIEVEAETIEEDKEEKENDKNN